MFAIIFILLLNALFFWLILRQFEQTHVKLAIEYVAICAFFSLIPTLLDLLIYYFGYSDNLKASTNPKTLLLYTSSFLSPIMYSIYLKYNKDNSEKDKYDEPKRNVSIRGFAFAILFSIFVIILSLLFYLLPEKKVPFGKYIFWAFIFYSVGMWILVTSEQYRLARPPDLNGSDKKGEKSFSDSTENMS